MIAVVYAPIDCPQCGTRTIAAVRPSACPQCEHPFGIGLPPK